MGQHIVFIRVKQRYFENNDVNGSTYFWCICFEAGVHPKVVQALMGHADYAVTMNVYTQVSERMIKNESEKVVSLLDNKDITQIDMFYPISNLFKFCGKNI